MLLSQLPNIQDNYNTTDRQPHTDAQHRHLPYHLEQRLSAKKLPDPAKLKLREDQAQKLAQAHRDATKERAAREIARAKDALARKLRLDEATRHKALKKIQTDNQREVRREAADREMRAAKQARRESLASAVRSARSSSVETMLAKAISASNRVDDACARKQRALQALVDHNAHRVKHAIAVATAVREKKRITAEEAAERMQLRLELAERRRVETLSATPERLMAALVERNRVEAEYKRDVKRAAIAGELAAASDRKQAILDAKVSKARSEVDKVALSLQARADEAAADEAACRRRLFDKLHSASIEKSLRDARASLAARKLFQSAGVAFDVDFERGARAAPAGLELRLSTVKSFSSPERHLRAHARRELALSARKAHAVAGAQRRALSRARIVAEAAETREAARVKAAIESRRLKLVQAQRVAAAKVANQRVFDAAARRVRARADKAKLLSMHADAHILALGRVAAARLVKAAGKRRVAAAVAAESRRAEAANAKAERANQLKAKAVFAAERRTQALHERTEKGRLHALRHLEAKRSAATAPKAEFVPTGGMKLMRTPPSTLPPSPRESVPPSRRNSDASAGSFVVVA